MTNPDTYYRLTIRFSNGETEKFILREPVDAGQITDTTRFVLVRSHTGHNHEMSQVFLASLADVSFVRIDRLDAKQMRQRVTGLTGSFDESEGPEVVATVEFL
ncbi:MAG: hypothetical protein IPF82_06010 [Blastocatellia bacterium]|jgi:hypothetical protein|nr:hypothetical protein [Blastocatellia bacterium]